MGFTHCTHTNPGGRNSNEWENTTNNKINLLAPTGTGSPGVLVVDFENSNFGSFSNLGANNWSITTGGTTSSGTGPTSATQGANYAYTEMSGPANNSTFILQTTDFASATELKYLVHIYADSFSNVGNLFVEYSSDNLQTWTALINHNSNEQQTQAEAFKEYTFNLTGLNINGIRFRAVKGSSWQSDFAIDNIRITSQNYAP